MGVAVEPLHAAALFYHHSDHWSRDWLAPGFRHCDVVIETHEPGVWLGIVGKVGGIVTGVAMVDFDPQAFAAANDAICVMLPLHRPQLRRWPFMTTTCVGLAKAVLGIRAPFIWTPYSLYMHLVRSK